ncbi:sulfite efflux pump [Trichophyton mentagrophytes]|nr:sulfite efflux pump SSU1 [Trichophyton interdigitale H6]GBF62876.1 sulfite efflux pump [Trichophyton mentagrophytes]
MAVDKTPATSPIITAGSSSSSSSDVLKPRSPLDDHRLSFNHTKDLHTHLSKQTSHDSSSGRQDRGRSRSRESERTVAPDNDELQVTAMPSGSGFQNIEEAGEKARKRDDWIAISNFHPGWFSVNMGTGITAILLQNLPYQFPGLHYIAVILFILNVIIFFLFLTISITRYCLWPDKFKAMLAHPAHSMLLGTFPMGFATIINCIVFICVPVWGEWASRFAWGLWWIDAIVSVAICYFVPFMLMTKHTSSLETMTAAWLLPIVAPVVAAASGGVVADALQNDTHALITILVCYVMWGSAVPLAMVILVIYFQRLAIHKLVPRAAIVSALLPIGPLGQGGFGLMQLGVVAKRVFPRLDFLAPIAGDIFYVMGAFIAMIMWGFGLIWLWFALASFTRGKFYFNIGWWAFTFPLGVFTTATTQMGKEFNSPFFDILGTFFSIVVTCMWVLVFALTVYKSCTKELFR